MENNFPGHFITLEGGEGSGKSTLLDQLQDFLIDQDYEVVTTREPGGTSLGESVRDWLLHQGKIRIGSKTELLLFLAARAQHIEELILPSLQAGKIVLCDRFNDSTIAYQGGARGLGIEYVKNLCEIVCHSVTPQLTLLLNVSPEIGLSRSKKVNKIHSAVGELDRIESESLAFHGKIDKSFQILAQREPLRIHPINADGPQSYVFQESIKIIQKYIQK